MNESKKEQNDIDPKDLMAVERSTTALLGTSISLIVLGFVIEKFELFLLLIAPKNRESLHSNIPQLSHISFYSYLGIAIVISGIILSIYTYRYYVKWILHLKNREIDTDKNIYLVLSIFIATIGLVLAMSMIVL